MSSRAENLAKFFRLEAPERRLFLLALVLLPTIGFAIRLFGFRRIQAALSRDRRGTDAAAQRCGGSLGAGRIAWLVAAAARHGPYRARCLPVALTLGWLLQREGIKTDLRFGVRKVAARFEAHAWIEHQGKPLIDTPEIHDHFAAFDRITAARKPVSR